MTRYVLRYTGAGLVPARDLDLVRERAWVVDEQGRLLLGEGSKDRMVALGEELPGWVAAPESVVPLPPARPQVKPVAGAGARSRRARA